MMSAFKAPPPGAIPSGLGSGPGAESDQDLASVLGGQASGGGSDPLAGLLSQSGDPGAAQQAGSGGRQRPARPIGTPVQEAKFLAADVAGGVLDLLPPELRQLLHAQPSDTPAEKQRKHAMFQRFSKLNAEQQAYVQKKLQHEQLVKRQQAEAEAAKRQQQAAAAADDLPIPQGKVSGEAAMGGGQSRKAQTINKLQSDRQKLKNAG